MVTANENFSILYDGIDATVSRLQGARVLFVDIDAFGVRVVIDGQDSVFDYHTFTRKGYNAFDDKFVDLAGFPLRIFENDYLTAFWNIKRAA